MDSSKENLETKTGESSQQNASNQQVGVHAELLAKKNNAQNELLEAFERLQDIPNDERAEAIASTLKENLSKLLNDSIFPQAYYDFAYDQLKYNLNYLLNPKPGILLSRYVFLNRKQKENESVSQYIDELRKQIVGCCYPDNLVDVMLRDAFISGLRLKVILNKLLIVNDMPLEVVLSIALSFEKIGYDDGKVGIEADSSKENSHHRRNTLSEKNSNNSLIELTHKNLLKTNSTNSPKSSPKQESKISDSEDNTSQVSQQKTNLDGQIDSLHKGPADPKITGQPIKNTRTDRFFASLPGSEKVFDCTVILHWTCATGIAENATLTLALNSKRNIDVMSTVLLELDLSEVIGLLTSASTTLPVISLPTMKNVRDNTTPLRLYPMLTTDFEEWFRCISMVWERIHDVPKIPLERSIWCINKVADVYVSDVESLGKIQKIGDGLYQKEFQYLHFRDCGMVLPNGFPYQTEVTISCSMKAKIEGVANEFRIDLIDNDTEDIAMNLNSKFDEQVIIHNSHLGGKWGIPEHGEKFNIDKKKDFTLTIQCKEQEFQILLNGSAYSSYKHKISPMLITHIKIDGQITVQSIVYKSNNIILDVKDLIWRKIKGKLRKVETTPVGITWGIDTNGMAVYYDGKSDEDEHWRDVGSMKLIDLSLSVLDDTCEPKTVSVWAVDEKGDVFYRHGVTTQQPSGTKWEHVETSEWMKSISHCGVTGHVWCTNKEGNTCFSRFGITAVNPIGESWKSVYPPHRVLVNEISVGKWAVWTLCTGGYLRVRKGISLVNLEGDSWCYVVCRDFQNSYKSIHLRHIFVRDEHIWGITQQGAICKLAENSDTEYAYWDCGLSGKWINLSE